MSSTYFYCLEVTSKACGIALLRMMTDNLSGAKGNTQSSAIIWLSLDPSLSLSGTSQHHPIANPWYLCLTSGSQSHWFPFTPFFMPAAPEPKAQSLSFSSYYTLQTFTIIIIIIMQNRNFINFILHHVYCNLVEYCNIVYCGTLCELYYNCVNVRSNKINLVHKL